MPMKLRGSGKRRGLPRPISTELEAGPTLFDIFRTVRKISTYAYKNENGEVVTHSQRGPLAYFLEVPAFEAFLTAYRTANHTAAQIQHSLRLGNESVWKGPLPDELVKFNAKYGLLLENMIQVVDLPGRRVPFINPFYFPRSARDMKYFWKFIDAVGEAYNLERGEVAGRPPGKSKYRPEDLSRYNKLKKKHASSRAIELAFPEVFDDESIPDPNKRLRPALSRLRKKKKDRAPKRAPLFRRD